MNNLSIFPLSGAVFAKYVFRASIGLNFLLDSNQAISNVCNPVLRAKLPALYVLVGSCNRILTPDTDLCIPDTSLWKISLILHIVVNKIRRISFPTST